MKHGTTKYWRLTNVGRPKDNEEGEGDTKALAAALVGFIGRVDMGSRLQFELYRSAEDRAGAKPKDDAQDILDSIFEGITD